MLAWTTIAQILWTSLATASYYVLFAVAFSLVLKVNGVFNFAQAGLMTIAFYAAHASVAMLGLGGPAAFVIALVATLAGAWALERFGFAQLRSSNASPMFVFIFTIVISEFIAYVAMLIFGTWPQTVFPQLFWPVTLVGEIAISAWDVPALATAIASLSALWLFLNFSRWGQFMVAVADNAGLAELYRLTAREMSVLLAIVEIGGVPAVAATLGLSPKTVKSYLREIFQKTGAKRQADLVKLVAGLANPFAAPRRR